MPLVGGLGQGVSALDFGRLRVDPHYGKKVEFENLNVTIRAIN